MSDTAMLRAVDICVERQGRRLLDGVCLDLPAQGAVALVGPNGAGKSTLLQVLAGQMASNSGMVRLDGAPLSTLSVPVRARHIGYMPQRFEPHWDVTLQELMRMRVPDATQALAQARLQPLAARRWSQLSGGERARGLLAAVLATDPPVLLADEPGAALDVRHRLALVQALARRGRERLVVVVMHDLDLAFECFERVIVLHQGRVAMDGAPAALLQDPQLDQVFGVHFQRIAVPPHTLLRARSQEPYDAH
ncbi:ABC transporter ATP-binding protein [Comamonas endophytica]|uniref:ABC transporter ATP-binding protein n=1 Tax=Comamonas endophytica TaxID=2949090 RepID=A0ABY6GAC0_9BURK|nr:MULTISPECIES: ABC transporter ATP-binding protein [unclassified Acidovorax]MCD2513993.1 ABC transporter ATP-binding protein [Acidovorax sp. D4N7]UYG52017.1 ABC transporter ATP-binding protein [Acidovorax sp. 5MLIR]